MRFMRWLPEATECIVAKSSAVTPWRASRPLQGIAMYDQLTMSPSGQLVLFDEFHCSTSGFEILQAMNRHRDGRTAPMSFKSVERSTLYRDSGARIISKGRNGWTAETANWGRSGRAGEDRYVQTGFGHVGVAPITSFSFRVVPDPKIDWVYDRWRAYRTDGWTFVTVAMNDPNEAVREFAIMLASASPDLQHLLRLEPATVPPTHWESAGGHFPPRAGAWRLERA